MQFFLGKSKSTRNICNPLGILDQEINDKLIEETRRQ